MEFRLDCKKSWDNIFLSLSLSLLALNAKSSLTVMVVQSPIFVQQMAIDV